MDIDRLQIEGGFLDGLDIKFSDGLNVLIGARGTGKTSVIELIRFALTARNHTREASRRSEEHAAAVLDDGEVTVQLSDLLDSVVVSRSTGNERPNATGRYEQPLIFSQTEIENVGLSEGGRLRLLDGFISESATLASDEAAAIAGIRSIFKEIESAEKERAGLAAGLEKLDELQSRIVSLEAEEAIYRSASVGLEKMQAKLYRANTIVSDAAVREGILDRFSQAASGWVDTLTRLVHDDFGPESWDLEDGEWVKRPTP